MAAFTVDFVVRLATCPSFFDFRTDVMNWIDFVAIVPYYVELLFDLLGLDSGAVWPLSARPVHPTMAAYGVEHAAAVQ